ncbi:PspC domain-containing protein [Bhargavaea beijingensis]|uniref:PspC domain-containing protein n=1 Tax=Bhargavaea beijingensis TaxID=426756 RepID=UPI003872BCA9
MRAKSDRVLFGVCGGIGDHLGIRPIMIRLLFMFVPLSPLIYLVLAILLQEDNLLY